MLQVQEWEDRARMSARILVAAFGDAGHAFPAISLSLALRDAGCAVLVISEELDELFEIADRLQVMARGKLSPSIARRSSAA